MKDERRRHLAWIIVLVSASALLSLWLRQRYTLGDVSSVVTVLGLPMALVGLYATVAGLLRGRAADQADLDSLSDALAVAVQRQWQIEEGLRRVNDPRALPIRWQTTAAAQALADSWDDVRALGAGCAGRRPHDPRGTPPPASTPHELEGELGRIADRFLAVPSRRLVILGEPGSGKSVLAMHLALDLLARREPGGAVPVLLSAASWRPTEQGFLPWLVRQVLATYPGLAAKVMTADGITTAADALVTANRVIMILDGLDEIPAAARGDALTALNRVLARGHQLVVTSRRADYQAISAPPGQVGVRLTGAALVEIQPLEAADIRDWLTASAPDPPTAARWAPVIEAVNAPRPGPAGQALRSPLMVSLARTIYTPAPGTPTDAVRNPAELLDTTRFGTREEVERWLFDGFIPAVYPRYRSEAGPSGRPSRWTCEQADRYLTFLARHLEHRLDTTDLAWWQLSRAAPTTLFVAAYGTLGLVIGNLLGWANHGRVGLQGGWMDVLMLGRTDVRGYLYLGTFLGTGLGIIAAVANHARVHSDVPPRHLVPRLPTRDELLAVLGLVALAGIVLGVAAGTGVGSAMGMRIEFRATAVTGGVASVATAVLSVLVLCLRPQVADQVTSAAVSLKDELRSNVMAGAATAIACGLTFGVGVPLGADLALEVGLTDGALVGVRSDLTGTAGLTMGVTAGITTGMTVLIATGLVPSFGLACQWLAWKGDVPVKAMEFMLDAHRRGVLRQAGPYYQFRHRDLQHRLATR